MDAEEQNKKNWKRKKSEERDERASLPRGVCLFLHRNFVAPRTKQHAYPAVPWFSRVL